MADSGALTGRPPTPEAELLITVLDLKTGEAETTEIPAGEYVIICTEPCRVTHVQQYPTKGTVILTVKGRIAR